MATHGLLAILLGLLALVITAAPALVNATTEMSMCWDERLCTGKDSVPCANNNNNNNSSGTAAADGVVVVKCSLARDCTHSVAFWRTTLPPAAWPMPPGASFCGRNWSTILQISVPLASPCDLLMHATIAMALNQALLPDNASSLLLAEAYSASILCCHQPTTSADMVVSIYPRVLTALQELPYCANDPEAVVQAHQPDLGFTLFASIFLLALVFGTIAMLIEVCAICYCMRSKYARANEFRHMLTDFSIE